MPVIKVYHHGLTAGIPPMKNDHQRGLKQALAGWSASSTRNNTKFLYSVEHEKLTGYGYAFTLTVKHCPMTSDEWHRIRKAWIMKCRRLGMIRLHWVTEWQRRGVPHLHCAVWFEKPGLQKQVMQAWASLTKHLHAGPKGQHVTPIRDPVGWFQYVSKHAARGLNHYQRAPENVPQQWKSKTGRMWGKWGYWPVGAPFEFELDIHGYHILRRMIRSWRIADARHQMKFEDHWKGKHRLKAARRMLKHSERNLSTVRGISEWKESSDSFRYLAMVVAAGCQVNH